MLDLEDKKCELAFTIDSAACKSEWFDGRRGVCLHRHDDLSRVPSFGQQQVGYVDLETGRRACGAAPSEIRAWSVDGPIRRPEEAVNLQKWIVRHSGRVNRPYGAFCDTPLHLAARFGREDLAPAPSSPNSRSCRAGLRELFSAIKRAAVAESLPVPG